ncbi:hypothetical protein AK812_SmicGene35593 [Symbiodinium microadriaticum]|uniref:Uncharacterized protein n=2 Tax=Symbiodinium microadriaticum TaxID=2951 RepID=A0A1Q9CL13_SYMMI|nr:hypothetical protein AK812_SmicGene35593 [Symbiodinium microadriaticum]
MKSKLRCETSCNVVLISLECCSTEESKRRLHCIRATIGMLHALWRVLFALGPVEVVQVVKRWRCKEQVVVVKVKVEVEVVVVEWPVKLWVVVQGVQALLSSYQLTENAMMVVEVERVVVEQEQVEVKVVQVEVE